MAAYPYTGWVAEAIRRFKYGPEPARADDLAARMVPVVRGCGAIDAIVPVPLHPKKLGFRGFNQSVLLADRVGACLDLPVIPLLARIRPTRPQVELDEQQRRENVADAFALDSGWSMTPGKRIVLIDDVRTTGATTDACAAVLRTSGLADHVAVVTLAREVGEVELSRWLQSVRGDDAV